MNCKICGEVLEEDDEEICKRCKKLHDDLEMDDLASNILYSPFNPGIKMLKEEKDWEELKRLFWEYVKTQNWNHSHVDKYTMIDILSMIEDRAIDCD